MSIVYKRVIDGKVVFLMLYVDDILLIGNDVKILSDVKSWLASQFQMKDLERPVMYLGSRSFGIARNDC